MRRLRALRIVLGVVGVLFLASGYPGVLFIREDPALSMMFSLYVTLGVFLLLAIRNPAEHRSLIAFTAWSSFAHAVVMGFQAMRGMVAHVESEGVGHSRIKCVLSHPSLREGWGTRTFCDWSRVEGGPRPIKVR